MAACFDLSDEEIESGLPERKPIGWNYQNALSLTSDKKMMEYSVIQTKLEASSPEMDEPQLIKPLNGHHNISSCSQNSSCDDIEVIEVLEVKRSHAPKPLFPVSSTRSEIKSLLRNAKQSSITRFFPTHNYEHKTVDAVVVDKNKKFEKNASKKTCVTEDKKVNISDEKVNVTDDKKVNIIDKKMHLASNNDKINVACCNKEIKIAGNKEINITDNKELSIASSSKAVNIITDENPNNLTKRVYNKEGSPSGSPSGSHISGINVDEEDITVDTCKTALRNLIERWRSLQLYSREDEKIEEKLWKHYNSCHISYTTSRKFFNGLKRARDFLNKENTYVTIKEIIDNLRHYKDVPYIEKKKKLNEPAEEEKTEELSEAERKRRKKLRRIEKEMIKLSKKIKALETVEVDFDDEDNSSYLLQERLKGQFVALDQYYCKLENLSLSTGRPVEKKFRYEGSRYPEINKRITLWVNKHREFPDFTDVLDLVKKVTKETCLPLRPETIRVQAQEIFRDVGKILKERREQDDLFSIYAYADLDMKLDPADSDRDLLHRLKENENEAKKKLDMVFQYYVDKDAESHPKNDKEATSKSKNEGETSENLKAKSINQSPKETNLLTNDAQMKVNAVSDAPSTENSHNSVKELWAELEEEDQGAELDEGDQGAELEEEDQESDSEGGQVTDLEESSHELDDDQESDIEKQEGEGIVRAESYLNGDDDTDDSEDDIQEIVSIMAATSRKEYEEEDDEEEEEEGEEIDETKDDFTEEDVEIADSPEVIDENENDLERELSQEVECGIKQEMDDSIHPNFTFFKRKIDVEENYLSIKKSRLDVIPEIVELD